MKLFALSLEEDASDWYINLVDYSYKYWDSFRKGFMEIFSENAKPRFLLNALQSIKRNENETMEEFNKKKLEILLQAWIMNSSLLINPSWFIT